MWVIDLFDGNSNRVVWVVRFELVQVITQPSKADMRYRVRRSLFAVKLTRHKTKSQSGINSNIE